jgi:glycerol dehydrogenase-like iron-containing ADH family enzyme
MMVSLSNPPSEKGWAESLPLQEKKYCNANHIMSSTIYKSLAKKNQQTKKKLNLKLLKIQQGQVLGQTCLNFFTK